MLERAGRVKEWIKAVCAQTSEFNRLRVYFPRPTQENGVLTLPGQNIDPIYRGFITAKESLGLIRKLQKEKELSNKERKSVREAAWLISISGNYRYNLTDEGMGIEIIIENPDASAYLCENTGIMVAFLGFKGEKRHEYRKSTTIKVGEKPSSIVFDFKQLKSIPMDYAHLYIHTRPVDENKVNKKFLRLNLLLLNNNPN